MKKLLFLIFSVTLFVVFTSLFISAWEFNGTIYDVNGIRLYNATINVTVRGQNFQIVGYNYTRSNQTGWFNLSVADNQQWMYEPKITHFEQNKTDLSTPIDYIGQSVPAFPYQELQNGLSVDFYLKEAGTINITAVNGSGTTKTFQYLVKDIALGYPIAEGFESYVSQVTLYVPRNRNYSIMIYPNQSMPVSFNWNNFSSTTDYSFTYNSNYNVTTHTLHKKFNVTENLIWVTGYALNSTGGTDDYNEFTVVPFILEPGGMIYLGENAAMPYNMSAWRGVSDFHNLTNGFYNITLPGPAESINYILFATARNGTGYYGGYRNVTLSYGSSNTNINFTMYPLMSIDWASANSNFTMNDAANWNRKNISSAKQRFNLINSTGSILSQTSAHIEVTIDYSGYNATEFTFMFDISQGGSASFYLPLINATGIKEMNIYSMNYAPKRVGKRSAAQILSSNNITLSQFNPQAIDTQLQSGNIVMELYISNSTCDVPNPASPCGIGSSSSMQNFNPLGAVIGGGKLSFRMGTGGILIHYVNVDMLASGPPDALFDNSQTETTTGDFNAALRFGSLGPTIYDYVLVSMPYTEGSTSQTGINENADVNMSIPLFYDENASGVMDWTAPIWNSSANGSAGSALVGNYSHFSARQSEWAVLMNQTNCTTNINIFNVTNPCYIDKTNNRIWIRLPHFSGNKPGVSGSVITASTTTTTTTGGSSGSVTEVKKAHSWTKITPGVAEIMKDFDKDIGIKEIKIEVNKEAQNVKITVTKYDGKPAEVSVEKTGKVYNYLKINTENLEENLSKATLKLQVNKSWVSNNSLEKENIVLFKFDNISLEWNELPTTYSEEDDNYYYYETELTSFSYFAIGEKVQVASGEGEEEETITETLTKNYSWVWIIIVVVILTAIFFLFKKIKKKRK